MLATSDEVLDILHCTGPDVVGGNSNYGSGCQARRRFGGVLPGLPGAFTACGTRCVVTAHST